MAPNPHTKKADPKGYRKEDVDRSSSLSDLLKQAQEKSFSVREKGRLFSLLPWRSLGISDKIRLRDLVQLTFAGGSSGPEANEVQQERRAALLVRPND
jgi:hypothetical protein